MLFYKEGKIQYNVKKQSFFTSAAKVRADNEVCEKVRGNYRKGKSAMDRWIEYELLDWEYLKDRYGIDEKGIITVPTASPNNCAGRCVVKIQLRDGKIEGIVTEEGPDGEECPQIRACVRGRHYLDTFLHKDRLLYPMKRVGKRGEGKFERISWQEAIDRIARENKRIRDTYGAASRYINYATGYEMCAAVPPYMMRRLLNLDGGFLPYYNNYSNSPSTTATKMIYGTDETANTPQDYENSKLIILWGHNPAETICGGNINYYIKKAKEKGTRIIVIDPRYSDTAMAFADQWIAPLPTTDSALSDAMAYVIYTRGLHNQAFLDRFCIGFEDKTLPEGVPAGESYAAYLLGKKDGIEKTPAWAEKITGIGAEKIEQLALEYALTKPAAIIEGYGAGRHAYGEQFSRGLITLACMTGNVGISGGSGAGVGQCGYKNRNLAAVPPAIENRIKVRIPCYLWTKAVEDGKAMTEKDGLKFGSHLESDIKMIFNLAGNCLVNQHGDCNYTKSLLEDETKVEFIVCSDIFMTASARYADILLPGTSMLETENITTVPSAFDAVFKINPIIKPLGECRFDYDWICDLAKKMGLYEEFSGGKTLREWLEESLAELRGDYPDFPGYEDFSRRGVYKTAHKKPAVAFEKEIREPEKYSFPTKSGKIELFSRELYQERDEKEKPAIPKYIPAWEGPSDPRREKYPLQCIGFHTKARTHSVHDNNPMLNSMFPQEMWIHPDNAKERGIRNGERVKVYNDRGRLIIPVKVTKRIVKGVVAIPQGAWFTPDEKGTDIRGCMNTLTSLRPTAISKANAQHTNLVQVEGMEQGGTCIEMEGSVCTGCQACVAACQSIHNLPPGVSFLRILKGSQADSCRHCRDAACKRACPVQAIFQDEEGRVVIDREKCIGCQSCIKACPYGNIVLLSDKKPAKCDLCRERKELGKEAACVAACPLRSLRIKTK